MKEWTESEVIEFRVAHEACMRDKGYPPEIICELATAREKFFPKKYRVPVLGTYRKPRFS